jgi:hypothetical protein
MTMFKAGFKAHSTQQPGIVYAVVNGNGALLDVPRATLAGAD